MYLAMPGIALAVGAVSPGPFAAVGCRLLSSARLTAVGLAALTAARNEVWRTPVSLWSDAVAGSPLKRAPTRQPRARVALDGQSDAGDPAILPGAGARPGEPPARTNLDVALEEQAEHRIVVDEEIELEGVAIGPDGTIALEPPDPCRDR